MLRLLWEGVAPAGSPDLSIVIETWTRSATLRALRNTLVTGIGGTLLALILGTGFALLVALTDIRAKAALVFSFILPLVIAPQVTAFAWMQAFGPNSPLLGALGLAPPLGTRNPLVGPGGIILLLGLHHAPLVFLAVRAGLRLVPRDLVEAAQAAGAAPMTILRTVILPLLGPALAAGTGLSFVSAIGNFGIPALLGIPGGYTVLVTLVYQRLAGFGPRVLPEVAAIGLGLAALAIIGLAVQRWRIRRDDVRVVSLAATTPGWRLGTWRPVVEASVWVFMGLILVLPFAALIATSIVPAIGVELTWERMTFSHYAYVLWDYAAARRAFVNSFVLAGLAAAVLMMAAVPLAVLADWRRSRAIGFLAIAAEFPYALPGVVLAIAMILVLLKPLPIINLSLYNTVWIIFAAYLARFLTLAWRPVSAGLAQVDRSLEEAAQGAGASFIFRLRTVIYPLLAPAAVAGAIIVFLTAFNELTVSALLWSSGAETLGVVLFSLDQSGESTGAAAIAVLTVIATLALMGVGAALGRRLPQGVLPWRP
ncbi:MAG: iron ABC transporter permease [Rhodospirillales bacterium]|nr:iron ABC transporter permease [Rhodospirillales bacterium]